MHRCLAEIASYSPHKMRRMPVTIKKLSIKAQKNRSMEKEYHIIAKGLVQGVCFRSLVLERAQSLDLYGYVLNLKDGTVEICLQGKESTIKSFLENLQQNSGLARIDSFSITVSEPKERFSSFSIRR